MKKILLLIPTIFLFTLAINAQEKKERQGEPRREMVNVGLAQQLANQGYTLNKPLYLVTAAQILIENPVKAEFVPTKAVEENDPKALKEIAKKPIVLNPSKLLDDAQAMAKGDQSVLKIIESIKKQQTEANNQTRGRKFSPLIKDYSVKSKSAITLYSTFNGDELAEVFVIGDGTTDLDLFVYDEKGNIITFDTNNIDNCYVSFIPPSTGTYLIKIKNIGKLGNNCLLMTN